MVDLSRRKTIIGMGLLATGSGAAFSSAAFQNSVNPGADFRIVAAAQTIVRRGPAFEDGEDSELDDWAQDEFLNFDELNPGDLPAAGANENQNDGLDVSLARQNSASEIRFSNFLEIDNTGTTEVSIGTTYAIDDGGEVSGYAQDGTTGWFNDDYVDDLGNDNLSRLDVLKMFKFEIPGNRLGDLANESGGSNLLLSPSPDDAETNGWTDGTEEEPSDFVTLGAGESITVDLVTELTGDQVSILANEAASATGNPFNGNETDDFQLLDSVFVGTED